jgi:hypothetical protein
MQEQEVTFKSLFFPFTTLKAVYFIIFIGFLVYANVLINGFVWDDKTYILNNPGVHSIDLVAAFKTSMFNQGGQYRPVSAIYFSVLYSLFATLPFFYHFIQISLHIVNTILLFIFFKHFFHKQLAFFLSLVFLVHPLQVESVAYIGASDNTLFVLFGISTLLLSVRNKVNSMKFYIIVSVLLLIAVLTKETGVLFVAMFVLYTFLYNRRKILPYSLLSFITIISYFVIRFLIGKVYFEKLDLVAIARLSFTERLLNIPSVIFYYLKNLFYPAHLAIGQEWVITQTNLQNVYLPLCIEILFLLFTVFYGIYLFKTKKNGAKMFLFFSLWLFSGVALHSQIFPLDWTVADRWFYFSLIGVLGIAGVLLQTSFKLTKKTGLLVTYGAAFVILLLLSTRTIVRNTNWHDAITLYTHDTKIANSWDIENNLGFEYSAADNLPEALKHFLKSVALFPFESSFLNVGVAYGNMGNYDKAVEYYYKALSAPHLPSDSHKHTLNAYTNTINGLLIIHNYRAAKKIATESVKDYPTSGKLWGQLAVAQYLADDYENAVESATNAKDLESIYFTQYIYSKIVNKQQIKVIPLKNAVTYL